MPCQNLEEEAINKILMDYYGLNEENSTLDPDPNPIITITYGIANSVWGIGEEPPINMGIPLDEVNDDFTCSGFNPYKEANRDAATTDYDLDCCAWKVIVGTTLQVTYHVRSAISSYYLLNGEPETSCFDTPSAAPKQGRRKGLESGKAKPKIIRF